MTCKLLKLARTLPDRGVGIGRVVEGVVVEVTVFIVKITGVVVEVSVDVARILAGEVEMTTKSNEVMSNTILYNTTFTCSLLRQPQLPTLESAPAT